MYFYLVFKEEFMKKILFTVCVFLLMALLSGCGKKSPDEARLKSLLSDSLLQYKVFDNVQYLADKKSQPQESYTKTVKSSFKSFDIIRRQTNGKSDYAECKIVLTDEYMDRTMKIGMHLNYYDKGSWFLDNWTVISEDAPKINKKYDLNRLKNYLENEGYALASDLTVKNDPGKLEYVGELKSISYPNMDYSGQVEASVTFERKDFENYLWNITYMPHEDRKWNITGNWYGEPFTHGFDYNEKTREYLYVNITGMDYYTMSNLILSFSGTVEHKFKTIDGGIGSYGVIPFSNKLVSTTAQNVKMDLCAGNLTFEVNFTPEEAAIRWNKDDTWAKLERR